jgi:squalene synthase HpnC
MHAEGPNGAPLPAPADLVAKSGEENFPVASRLLPRRVREQLLAVYGFARLVDDLGDEWVGDRLDALEWLETELDRALASRPAHPLVARAAATVRMFGLDDGLLRRLIEANRRDQLIHRYPTLDDLLGYCQLSANPIGRLVLGIFGAATPERERWSDRICSGLQMTEHWQDVAEDRAAGRVYLPMEDLERFGVAVDELGGGVSSPAMRGLIAFEVARARGMLDAGMPLVSSLRGRSRWAVAGFVAGGQAALDAITHADFEVLTTPRSPSRRRFACRLVAGLVWARPARVWPEDEP